MRQIILLISIVAVFAGCATSKNIKLEKESGKTVEKTKTKKEKKTILFPEIYFYPDKDLALREMEQEMEEEPDFLFKMANSYFDSARYDEAQKIYGKIVKNYFQTYDVFPSLFNLGLISIKKNLRT